MLILLITTNVRYGSSQISYSATFRTKDIIMLWGIVKGGVSPCLFCHLGVYAGRVRGRRSRIPKPASNAIPRYWREARSTCRGRTQCFCLFGHVVETNETAAQKVAK